jgi:hypothetical protein
VAPAFSSNVANRTGLRNSTPAASRSRRTGSVTDLQTRRSIPLLIATMATVLVCLILYAFGVVKVTRRFVLVVVAATLGIGLMYLTAWILSIFGVDLRLWTDPSPTGIAISMVICIVAALNLFIDFAVIDAGIANGAPSLWSGIPHGGCSRPWSGCTSRCSTYWLASSVDARRRRVVASRLDVLRGLRTGAISAAFGNTPRF